MLKIRSSLILWKKLSRCPWLQRWDQVMHCFSRLAGGIVCEVNLQAFHFRCGFSLYSSCVKPRAVLYIHCDTYFLYFQNIFARTSRGGGVTYPSSSLWESPFPEYFKSRGHLSQSQPPVNPGILQPPCVACD